MKIQSTKIAIGPVELNCVLAREVGWTEADIEEAETELGTISRAFTARAEHRRCRPADVRTRLCAAHFLPFANAAKTS